jgi:hypothetical protein
LPDIGTLERNARAGGNVIVTWPIFECTVCKWLWWQLGLFYVRSLPLPGPVTSEIRGTDKRKESKQPSDIQSPAKSFMKPSSNVEDTLFVWKAS